MLVNPEETNAGEELLEALDNAEQEPTDDVENADADATEADDAADEADEAADEDDEADADDGDEADDDTRTHTVKINGQDVKVTLKELTEGYMKDADYRRKTADLADKRKQVEAVEAEYTGGLKTLEQQLTTVATFIATQINAEEADMDKLVAEKPAEALKLQRELAKKGNLLQQIHAQLQNVQHVQANKASEQAKAFRDAEQARLQEVAPEFRKPEAVQRLHTYLKDTFGFDQALIDEVADHRFTLIAEKARRFDAIKAKGALKEKQVKTTPAKFQKGGAAARTNEAGKARDQAFKTVLKSGKVDNLAALF